MNFNIKLYWESILKQDLEKLKYFFQDNACIRWHNTNEKFTTNEFLIANCEYPGKWDGEIERIEALEDKKLIITVVKVFSKDKSLSFHVTSFLRLENDKIIELDEYWGDDGGIPKWRLDRKIGTPIK